MNSKNQALEAIRTDSNFPIFPSYSDSGPLVDVPRADVFLPLLVMLLCFLLPALLGRVRVANIRKARRGK